MATKHKYIMMILDNLPNATCRIWWWNCHDGLSQNINKATETQNDTLEQVDFLHFLGHYIQKKNIYFSSAHGKFSRIDYILGHHVEINSNIFYDHNGEMINQPQKKK